MVGGTKLSSVQGVTPELQQKLAEYSKKKAYEIIDLKGSTFFGIAACATTITRAALNNTCQVLPLSTWNEEYQLYISQPSVLGKGGIKETLPLQLSDEEQAGMDASAASMRKVLDSVEY